MGTYTIIGGVNGVGKSSFTGVLKESKYSELGTIIDVDEITSELGGNALKGGKVALNRINDCIKMLDSFTQETTLSGRKTEDTIHRVKALGYRIRLYYIGLDTAAESIARIENRVRRGGHNIPDGKVEFRFAGRWEAVAKILPLCDEAEFYDNNNGFVKVAEFRNGELQVIRKNPPRWIDEFENYLKEHQ